MVKEQQTSREVGQLEKLLYDFAIVYRQQGEHIRKTYGVSALEMEILQFVILEGKKKMKEIGEYFHIKLSTLTSIIDKIERQKLVKRVNSKDDRRVVYLESTKKGETLYEEYSNYLRELSGKLESQIGASQYKSAINGLEKILELSQ